MTVEWWSRDWHACLDLISVSPLIIGVFCRYIYFCFNTFHVSVTAVNIQWKRHAGVCTWLKYIESRMCWAQFDMKLQLISMHTSAYVTCSVVCLFELSPVSTTRVDGPSWRVTCFHYPSTRAVLTGARFPLAELTSTRPVLTGNGNRSPVNSGSGNRALVIRLG